MTDSGWQIWHVIALAAAFAALIIFVRRLRRRGQKSGQAAFLTRCPDAAKLYASLKGEDRAPFKIKAVDGARPCRFADRAGRGAFVPAGKREIAIGGTGPPVTLEWVAAPYGTYKLNAEDQKTTVIEMESL